jgi:hypothetical protein
MWYCGLNDAELHVARVRARVRRGGHDIPTGKIRERFDASRNNLCSLLPSLDELTLYDNSIEADPSSGVPPQPLQLLHLRDGKILGRVSSMPTSNVPAPAFVLDNTQVLSILRGCLAATRGESRTTEKAMTSGSMKMMCRYLLK